MEALLPLHSRLLLAPTQSGFRPTFPGPTALGLCLQPCCGAHHHKGPGPPHSEPRQPHLGAPPAPGGSTLSLGTLPSTHQCLAPHPYVSAPSLISLGYIPGLPGRASQTAALTTLPRAPGWLPQWLLLQAQVMKVFLLRQTTTQTPAQAGAQQPPPSDPSFKLAVSLNPALSSQSPISAGKHPRCSLACSIHCPSGTLDPRSLIRSAPRCTGRSCPG